MAQTVLKNEVTELSPDKGMRTERRRAVADYEKAGLRLAKIIRLAEEAGDIKTADLLTGQLGRYEENAWMLRATIAE